MKVGREGEGSCWCLEKKKKVETNKNMSIPVAFDLRVLTTWPVPTASTLGVLRGVTSKVGKFEEERCLFLRRVVARLAEVVAAEVPALEGDMKSLPNPANTEEYTFVIAVLAHRLTTKVRVVELVSGYVRELQAIDMAVAMEDVARRMKSLSPAPVPVPMPAGNPEWKGEKNTDSHERYDPPIRGQVTAEVQQLRDEISRRYEVQAEENARQQKSQETVFVQVMSAMERLCVRIDSMERAVSMEHETRVSVEHDKQRAIAGQEQVAREAYHASVEKAERKLRASVEKAERKFSEVKGPGLSSAVERVRDENAKRNSVRTRCKVCGEWLEDGVCKCTRDGSTSDDSDSEISEASPKNPEARVINGAPPGLGQTGELTVPYAPFHPLRVIVNHNTWADLFVRGARPQDLRDELTSKYVKSTLMEGHSVLFSQSEKTVAQIMKMVDTALMKKHVMDESVGDLLVDLQVNLVWAQHGRPAAEAYRASIENDLLPDREKAATKASLKAKAEAVKPKAEKEYTASKAPSGSPFPGRPGLTYPAGWQSMNKAKRAAWKKAQGL